MQAASHPHRGFDLAARLGRAGAVAMLGLAASFTARAGDNLIKNPGFEEVAQGLPAAWDLYIGAGAKAAGKLDPGAHEGKQAALLRTEERYPDDPLNNWSQNIFGSQGAAKYELSAAIKSEEAGYAAVWVQCWRRQPWGVVFTATTADKHPVSGTTAWQEVACTFDAPPETDFLTLRCVIRGTGTVWFDDIALTVAPAPPKADTPSKPAPKPEAGPALPVSPPRSSGESDSAAKERIESLEATLKALRESNSALTEALGSLRGENKTLSEELQTLRLQIEALQQQLSSTPPAPPKAQAPPLVPHGHNPESYR